MRRTAQLMIAGLTVGLATAAIGADRSLPSGFAGGRRPLQLNRKFPLPGVEGRIDHMAADVGGGRLFVAALGNHSIEILDLKDGKHLRSIPGLPEPQGIAYLAASDRIVVACAGDGSCRIYDGRSGRLVSVLDLKEDADNVRWDAATGRIYVGYGSGALAAIDPARGARIADVPLKGHPESFQLEARGKRIFVNVPTARQIAVVDRDQNRLLAAWPLDGDRANFPMALDEENHRLLVGCRKPPRMLVLDTTTGRSVASAACAADTDDVFYDAARKRVYLSGGEGAIDVFQQIDPDRYQLLDRIPTAAGARTSLFVPATGSLYLAVPRRGDRGAEIWEYKTGAGAGERPRASPPG